MPAIKGDMYINTHCNYSQPTLIKLYNENIGGHLTPLQGIFVKKQSPPPFPLPPFPFTAPPLPFSPFPLSPLSSLPPPLSTLPCHPRHEAAPLNPAMESGERCRP